MGATLLCKGGASGMGTNLNQADPTGMSCRQVEKARLPRRDCLLVAGEVLNLRSESGTTPLQDC